MLTRALWIVMLVLGLAGSAYADEPEKKDPIDVWEEVEISKSDGSSFEMIMISNKAYKMWDAELNAVYGRLLRKLSPKQAQALRASQRNWIVYRDLEFKLIAAVHEYDGWDYRLLEVSDEEYFVKQRVLALRGYESFVDYMGHGPNGNAK